MPASANERPELLEAIHRCPVTQGLPSPGRTSALAAAPPFLSYDNARDNFARPPLLTRKRAQRDIQPALRLGVPRRYSDRWIFEPADLDLGIFRLSVMPIPRTPDHVS